jgi:diguanylate cyclase (GGDEF)-like protein
LHEDISESVENTAQDNSGMNQGQRNSDVQGNDGPRILVVDDDQSILELMSLMLEEGGYQPSTAESAEEALTLFENDPFPLVFTDIRMSGMDGIELLKRIRKTNDDTQVVMITGHASLQSSLTSLREGAYDYLIKPIADFDVVLAVVERALEKVRLIIENRYLFEKLETSNRELESANSTLREITLRDGLTGLYNHRYLQEAIKTEVKRSQRHGRVFSILFCDIDHFKRYNDEHGHLMGDEVLRKFSDLLSNRLRQTDIACRYGGEEFVIMLPETNKESAVVLANSVRKLVSEHNFMEDSGTPGARVTVSIGVSSFPEDGERADDLLNCADKALYHAKRNGRNLVQVGNAAQRAAKRAG